MIPDGYNDKISDSTQSYDNDFESVAKVAVESAVKFLTETILKDLNVAVSYGKLSGVDYSYVITVREKPDGNFITQEVLELSEMWLSDFAQIISEVIRTAVKIAYDTREILMLREEGENAAI